MTDFSTGGGSPAGCFLEDAGHWRVVYDELLDARAGTQLPMTAIEALRHAVTAKKHGPEASAS